MANKSRVINKQQEVGESKYILDGRRIFKRLSDAVEAPSIPLWLSMILVPLVVFIPALFMLSSVLFAIAMILVITKPDALPIHLPRDADKDDINDPKPGVGKGFYKSRGSFYLGVCRRTGFELWASLKAITQHFLIFGTTGAGKTEAIVSFICNFLALGSGAMMNDAKAAPKAMFQMATFCRIFSRDFDYRVTNYIGSPNPEDVDYATRSSNDAGIFARGTPDANTQLLVSLMPPGGNENKVFSERAIALVAAIMPGLNDKRNLGKIQIDPSVIRRFMGFEEFVSLCFDNDISKKSRDALVGYLSSLSGYDKTKPISKQGEEVTRQFGFAQAYFTRTLASLADTYGHIYLTGQGEIDYQDAVLNGRILMTLLPSMSKSGEDLANLGKIILTASRNGMVVGLGSQFEGSAEQVVHNLPTNSEIPYGIWNDENAYMLVEGQEMSNAQARGLGFSIGTGTQDAPGMLLTIEKTTKQIMANSAFKFTGYLDDKDTTDLAIELSGEAKVLVRNSYSNTGDLGQVYASDSASVEKINRLNATAVRQQSLGQFFLTYQGNLHETQVFNHGIQEKHSDPKMCYLKHWWPVRMAKVHVPVEVEFDKLLKIIALPSWLEQQQIVSDNARHQLREMTLYFRSMIQMQRIESMSRANPEMRSLFAESVDGEVGETSISDAPAHDALTGILKEVHDTAVEGPEGVYALFLKLAELKDGPNRRIREAAAQSGISSFLENNADMLREFEADDPIGDAGDGGGGGGGPIDQPSYAMVMDQVLGQYFGGEPDITVAPPAEPALLTPLDPVDHVFDAFESFDEEADSLPTAFTDRADKSDMATMVEQHMMLMPWMSGVVSYETSRDDFITAETYFTDGDAALAQTNVDQTIKAVASTLAYPTTPMGEQRRPDLNMIRSLLNQTM